MSDWYEDWTGQSEALTKFGTGNVSAASTAAAIVAKAKAEAECPPEVTAKAAELGVMDFVGCNAYRAAVKAGKTKQEATSEAIKVVSTFRSGEGKKSAPAKAPPPAAPSPATYAAPAAPSAAAPAAPAADAPKPAEEPWWSSTAAKAGAVAVGAGVLTLAFLRRK